MSVVIQLNRKNAGLFVERIHVVPAEERGIPLVVLPPEEHVVAAVAYADVVRALRAVDIVGTGFVHVVGRESVVVAAVSSVACSLHIKAAIDFAKRRSLECNLI